MKKSDLNQDNNIDFLHLLGISIDNGKIEIDTNRAKSFVEDLQKSIEERTKVVESSIKEGKIDLKESVGVKIEDEKIEIDLKKTKSFLEEITNKAQSFINSLGKSFENLKNL